MENISETSTRQEIIKKQIENIDKAIQSAEDLGNQNPEENLTFSPLNEFLKINRESLMTAEIITGFFRGITTNLHSGTVDLIYGILNKDVYRPVLDLLLGNKPIMVNGMELNYRQEIRQKFNQCIVHPPTALICGTVILTAFSASYFVVALSVIGLFSDRIFAFTGPALVKKGIKPLLFLIDFVYNGGVVAFSKLSSAEMTKFFHEVKDKGVLQILNERKSTILANGRGLLGQAGAGLIERAKRIRIPMSISEVTEGLSEQGAGMSNYYMEFIGLLRQGRNGISESGRGVMQTLDLLLKDEIPTDGDLGPGEPRNSFAGFLKQTAASALMRASNITTEAGSTIEGVILGTTEALLRQHLEAQNSDRCEILLNGLNY